MKLILLGTGTSTGIPEVGCQCGLCQSSDTRDKRLRTSALLITDSGKRILIDCGPDFRQQALSIDLDRVDAILITHEHYDHVYGLDDLRTIAFRREIPIYGQPHVLESIKRRMHYVFSDHPYPGTPQLRLRPLVTEQVIEICGVGVQPIVVMHGKLPIYGYRFGSVAYITDMKTVEPDQWKLVDGVRLLVINALYHSKLHPSHHSVVDMQRQVDLLKHRPELTLLTHLTHYSPSHQALEALLPEDIRPGYDRLVVDVPADGSAIHTHPFTPMNPPFEYRDCGRIAYAEAWDLQHRLFDSIISAKAERRPTKSYLLLCEHDPVFTLGKNGDNGNMLMSEDYLRSQGYDYYQVERGGDVTYHGPGQITGYPILDLEQYGLGLRTYIELIEDVIIDLLLYYGITGERKDGATGVWIDPLDPTKARKICAIGVRSSRYVTMHGFALNVNTDLTPFGLINPCGFKDGKVTSIKQEIGSEVDFTFIKQQFSARLGARLRALMPQPY